jgi:hypothetical protein
MHCESSLLTKRIGKRLELALFLTFKACVFLCTTWMFRKFCTATFCRRRTYRRCEAVSLRTFVLLSSVLSTVVLVNFVLSILVLIMI